MGIEEIKKAKEEAKKTITRPSQKVAALLIALGPATASEILKNIKDEDLNVSDNKTTLNIVPMTLPTKSPY